MGFNPDELVQMVQFIAQNAHDINVRLSRIESILIREELIKQIEKEKMKASVFLTGNLTEKEKIAKINNIDMEVEIVDNFKTDPYFTLMRDPISVKQVWTKKMAEDMVMKGNNSC
jgi:hypothetical protein